ncbi:TetR/AcrR family transcriptional regulator [Mycobacterium sp. ACS4331]|uniref:TetR/AcrR family transcriptional regulator n=1 Tax=Mycobacterium sp. ACS4331 TaxID=1834121 RepID=UPI0008015BC1|nr:TetR/AcrR family transcriptional regulator [Mycobacterium sp. ACS4331]OBF13034.1 TetR family transcriptional regulator [Mycobacterium sp. ACS4331]
MPTPRTASTDRVRRRPKDRKAQIARVAAEAFSARGYHAVGMDDIAAVLDISATALYRHYANKYDMFRAAVLTLGQQLVDATSFCDDAAPDLTDEDAVELQARMVDAIVDVALANRDSAGLYRWEGRYLEGDDQAALMSQIRVVNRRIQIPLRQRRPQLSSSERWTLSSAAMSVMGSIADHRAKLPPPQTKELMRRLVGAVLDADLPTAADAAAQPSVSPRPVAETAAIGRYEAVLQQSLLLFDEHGYHETGMGQIAAAVGMPTSAIYRYFAGKQDILAAVFRRAADRVSGELTSALAGVTDSREALLRLVEAYVASAFAYPELSYVYYAERVNLGAADQEMLRNVQRSTVGSWARLLVDVRPEFSSAQARFVVHAAMALVIDLGRLVSYQDSAHAQACVRRMMHVTLGVEPL